MAESMHYFPDRACLLANEGWLSPAQLGDGAPVDALCYPGLMTQAVRERLGRQPRISRHQQDNGQELRSIAFYAENELFLLAVSLIPASLLRRHAWLRELGDNPLGEAIERHAGVQRNDFEILPVKANSMLAANFNRQSTYARRYRFELADGQIWVMELFNPDLLAQLQRQLQS